MDRSMKVHGPTHGPAQYGPWAGPWTTPQTSAAVAHGPSHGPTRGPAHGPTRGQTHGPTHGPPSRRPTDAHGPSWTLMGIIKDPWTPIGAHDGPPRSMAVHAMVHGTNGTNPLTLMGPYGFCNGPWTLVDPSMRPWTLMDPFNILWASP